MKVIYTNLNINSMHSYRNLHNLKHIKIQHVAALFLILFLMFTFISFYFSEKYTNSVNYFYERAEFNNPLINSAVRRKYITSSFPHPAGLGNMLFRFASLYGIGIKLDRIPFVNASIEAAIEGLNELSENFPLLHEFIEIKSPHESLIQVVDFANDCCIYESPKKLENYPNSKYLKLSGDWLQSFKYFDKYKTDIKKLMECSESTKQKANEISKEMWKNDADSHKLCVHVRRGDFVPYWPLETRMDFVIPATEYIFEELQKNNKSKVALLIFGNDQEFIQNMTFPNSTFTSQNTLFSYPNISRGFEMCFAIQNCDTLLISASSSTFGWWIGYLMKSQGPIYYNAIITSVGTHPKDHHDFELFLPHWKKLMVQENGKIKEETKWTIERNKN